jgi:hypothetical protein
MTTNYINQSVLALIAAVAVSANSSPAGEGAQPRDESGIPPQMLQYRVGPDYDERIPPLTDLFPSRQFRNLVTDAAALEAWLAIGPPQPEIIIEGTPLNDVAWNTSRIFKNQFDLVLPPAETDLSKMVVQMRLKDVRAIEVFNAMNLYFEVQKLPARWKLTLNGSRPTAILGMEKPQPAATPPPATEKIAPTVFSIVEILSLNSEAGDKQPTDSLADAIAAVLDDLQKPGRAKVNAPGGPTLKMHAQAGILVFSGTWEETELVRSTLAALKDAAISRSNKARDLELRAKDEAARKAAEDARIKALQPPPPKGGDGAKRENKALDDARNAALTD